MVAIPGTYFFRYNKPLYDYLFAYNGDQMAQELNMESKHSIEKQAAHYADCFTTVSEITANECKELLVVIVTATQREEERPCMVHCVNITGKDDLQEFTFAHHRSPNELPPPSRQPSPTPEHFLYEPNASIMKAGCFAQLEQACAARQLAPNSHLFLSADEIGDFPGRRFKIMAISSMNKKELKHALSPLESANIAVRNFPLSAEQLRKRLKLKEGGIDYIFATTDGDGSHKLYICRKIS